MSTVTEGAKTSNQAKFDYDISKIFIWDNRYAKANFNNNTGASADFAPGLVLGRIASSAKLVPFDASATNGAQIPVGILKSYVTSLGDGSDKEVAYCISGDIAEEKISFEGSETLSTVVTAGTGNTRIVRDMLLSLGIKIVETDEQTEFDN